MIGRSSYFCVLIATTQKIIVRDHNWTAITDKAVLLVHTDATRKHAAATNKQTIRTFNDEIFGVFKFMYNLTTPCRF
jgi:hypothetical protein